MTRKEAIEYFKFHRKIFCGDHLKICPKDSIAYQATLKEKEFYDMAIKALEQEPRWISVSERMPKAEYGESDSVLVCFENGTQDVLYFDGSNWRYPTGESYISVNYKNGWHNKVLAWMPLPTSYKRGEEV